MSTARNTKTRRSDTMSLRLRPADIAAIDALVKSGIARNKSQAISYALNQAHRALAA